MGAISKGLNDFKDISFFIANSHPTQPTGS